MNFLDCTTERGRQVLADLYKQLTGQGLKQTQKAEGPIQWDIKLESLEEIDKLIRQPSKLPKGAYFHD